MGLLLQTDEESAKRIPGKQENDIAGRSSKHLSNADFFCPLHGHKGNQPYKPSN